MSSEFPPIIIDSSALGVDDLNAMSAGSRLLSTRTTDFGSVAPDGSVTLVPSKVSLYLVQQTQLVFKGDFESDQIDLICQTTSEETRFEQAIAAGAGSATVHPDADAAGGVDVPRTFQHAPRRVHSIRVPSESELLRLGRDFDNFILIIQRKKE